MKKAALLALRYLSAFSAFFAVGGLIIIIIAALDHTASQQAGNLIAGLAVISALYAATSPITFSVKHFLSLTMTSRLMIQTAVNYPLLVITGFLFGWIENETDFYRLTTYYFFLGLGAAIFICIYYPRKYKLYNSRLSAYTRNAEINDA